MIRSVSHKTTKQASDEIGKKFENMTDDDIIAMANDSNLDIYDQFLMQRLKDKTTVTFA